MPKWEEDLLGPAVSEALSPILHLEEEWDQSKLEKRIRSYFKNSAKNLEFYTTAWNALIEEYADRIFASIFQALSNREWVLQADFLLVLDAGIKETFPKRVLADVPQPLFERAVLLAHDRAFEEQRFSPLLWESIVAGFPTDGPKTKKRIYEAFEAGRKDAAGTIADQEGDKVEAFVERWIATSIRQLRRDCPDELEEVLAMDQCTAFVEELIAAGGLPLSLTNEAGIPSPGTLAVAAAVEAAYTLPALEQDPQGPATKASKARRNGYGQAAVPEEAMAGPSFGWGKGCGKGCGKVGGKSGGKSWPTQPPAWGKGKEAWGAGKGMKGEYQAGPRKFGAAYAAAAGAYTAAGAYAAKGAYTAAGAYAAKGAAPTGWAPKRAASTWAANAGQWGGSAQGSGTKRLKQNDHAAEAEAVEEAPAAAEAAAAEAGHPRCTQQEDCQGNPRSPLVQHMDNEGVLGDVYCRPCWTVFSTSDPSLKAVPYKA